MRHPAILAAAALALILVAAWLASIVAERRRRGMRARLGSILEGPRPGLAALQPGSQIGGAMSLRRPMRSGGGLRLGLLPVWLSRHLAEELGATGDRVRLAQLVIVGLFGALLAAGVLLVVLRWPILVALPLMLAAGIALAVTWLRSAQQRFQRRFIAQFPEALDVIVRAVRAGLPVLDAIEAAVGNVGDPVSSEFRRLLDELRIGIELENALAHAASRIRVSDFRFFAATLVLQRRTGGSLAETLVNLAGLIRRRKELRLKANALSAESRATAYVIGALPFVMMGLMYLINSSLVTILFTDHRGKVMLWIAAGLLTLGYASMRAMINKATR